MIDRAFISVISDRIKHCSSDWNAGKTVRTVVICATVLLSVLMMCVTYSVSAKQLYGPYQIQNPRVYDGDTVYADILIFPFQTVKMGIRIRGIQAPEIRTKRDCEKANGYEARDFLADIMSKSDRWTLVEVEPGAYNGRVIGDLIVDGSFVSELMLFGGHAMEYDGNGKAPDWVCLPFPDT